MACQGSGSVFVTYDGGTTWTLKGSRNTCQQVAISADGTMMYAVGTSTSDPVFASNDSGANWASRGVARTFVSVAVSADGYRLIAGTGGGTYATFISHDAGNNWVQVASNTNSTMSAISGDGTTPLSNCYNCSVSTYKNAHNHWYSGMCFIGEFSEGANAEGVYLGSNRFYVLGGEGIDLY